MDSSNNLKIKLESLREQIVESIHEHFHYMCFIFQFNLKLPIKVAYDGDFIDEDLLGIELENTILVYGSKEVYDSMNICNAERYSLNELSIEQLLWVLNEIENENGTWYSV